MAILDIFGIPQFNKSFDLKAKGSLMVHNLSAVPVESTKMIPIFDLLSNFIDLSGAGNIKVRLIENVDKRLPIVNGDIFVVASNELVIFKQPMRSYPAEYELMLFTKGIGKFCSSTYNGTDSTKIVEADFIRIYQSYYPSALYIVKLMGLNELNKAVEIPAGQRLFHVDAHNKTDGAINVSIGTAVGERDVMSADLQVGEDTTEDVNAKATEISSRMIYVSSTGQANVYLSLTPFNN